MRHGFDLGSDSMIWYQTTDCALCTVKALIFFFCLLLPPHVWGLQKNLVLNSKFNVRQIKPDAQFHQLLTVQIPHINNELSKYSKSCWFDKHSIQFISYSYLKEINYSEASGQWPYAFNWPYNHASVTRVRRKNEHIINS